MNYTITIYPKQDKIQARQGEILLEALARQGYYLSADCGGKGTCGKCKVRLLRGETDGAVPDENGDILSCKARVKEDLEIFLSSQSGSGVDIFQSIEMQGTADGLGVILDVGTTTLAACLVDLRTGETLGKRSALNPQGVYGADVLSRIQACQEGKLGLLQRVILQKSKELIEDLAQGREIKELIVAANTTMLHIFLGVNPQTIGAYPFTPVFTATQKVAGESLGLPVEKVRLLPSASGYIGSDITAGTLACLTENLNKTQLFVDVGTNGEAVLSHQGKLYTASTAAGPALEGACIECGMGGVAGAIDKVWVEHGKLLFTTIDGAAAQGICGSGLIDCIAVLLREGILDESGAFEEENKSALIGRLDDDAFYLTENVYVSQKDVRQFQLAKSAISAGIQTLLKECNVRADEVETLYIAGSLGYHMDVQNAARTGLIPKPLCGKIKTVGNTALSGARLCLLSDEKQKEIENIAQKMQNVELSFSKIFQDLYVENMLFDLE